MKYEMIMHSLIGEFQEKGWPEGSSVPGEHALANRFQVSRMTARRALNELQKRGLIQRAPGKGNVLIRPVIQQGFLKVKPFKEYARQMGSQAKSEVLKMHEIPAPDNIVGALGLPDGEQVIEVCRLRYLDREPVMLEQRFLRSDLCRKIMDYDLSDASLHEILISDLKLPLTRVAQTLKAINLDAQQATQLDTTQGSAAFRLERITFTYGAAVTWVAYTMRGDRYQFEDDFEPNY